MSEVDPVTDTRVAKWAVPWRRNDVAIRELQRANGIERGAS